MLTTALGLGLLVGVVIGALGGGGSVLTVPLLVYALGLTAQEATTGSLVIVGVTAAFASLSHARTGGTRWATGLLLAAVGTPAAVLGTHLNRRVDQGVLLLAFAALMLVSAAGMVLRSAHGHDASHEPASPSARLSGSPRPAPAPTRTGSRSSRALRLVPAGLALGFLTGFLGVGGGFLAVPVLVIALELPMTAAVGTSLLVIALNAGVSLVARAGSGDVAWHVVAPFTAAAVLGSLLGKTTADRVPTTTLTRAFATLLVAVGLYVTARAALDLT